MKGLPQPALPGRGVASAAGPVSVDPLAGLLPAALAGETASLTRVLHGVGPGVLAVVRAVLGPDNPDVADVAQESLMAIRSALRGFRGDSTVCHYARRVALRVALSARRRARRRDELSRRTGPPAWSADLDGGGLADDPTLPVLRARRIAAFRGLLAELPDAQAESLAMRVVLEYSLPQIAEKTGAPVNTVRSRVRLALEELRRRIGADAALRDIFGDEP